MRPALTFIGGAILIWIVANGKAGAVWDAITGSTSSGSGNATRPPDPSTGSGGAGGGTARPGTPPRTG